MKRSFSRGVSAATAEPCPIVDALAASERRARRGRITPIEMVMAASAAALLAIVPVALLAQRYAAVEKARSLEVSGPPCPKLSAARYAALGAPAKQTTNVEGLLYSRQYGYVDCEYVATDHGRGLDRTPVCRFNSPTLLAVTTPRGRFFFSTGIAPATVTLADGRPRCVLAAAGRMGHG